MNIDSPDKIIPVPTLDIDVVPATEEQTLLALIQRVATDPTIDVDRARQVLDIYQEVKKESARKSYNNAMAIAQSEIKKVVKNKENSQTRSRYADLEQVDDAMKLVTTSNGFSLSFDTKASASKGNMVIKCLVTHRDGYERWYEADIPTDIAGLKGNANKTGTHAFGSTVSYARRYLKMMIFDVATTDNDGNPDTGPVDYITDEEAKDLYKLIQTTNANEKRFLNYIRASTVETIPAGMYQDAKKSLIETHAKRMKAGA